MSLNRSQIGTAPVSYGIAGAHAAGLFLRPEELLSQMSRIGYAATELGPPAYFGSPGEVVTLFARYGLTAIGAYVPLRLDTVSDTAAGDLEDLLRVCRRVGAVNPAGLIILASETTPVLKRHPARNGREAAELGLTTAQWSAAMDLISTAMTCIADQGLRSTFHPHMCSYIESLDDIDRLIGGTGVTLTLDTGHLVTAGADPSETYRRWADRIDHVHLKDVDVATVRRTRSTGGLFRMSLAARPLGTGDVDLRQFLAELDRAGYEGWIVIEQDHNIDPDRPVSEWVPAVAAEQASNFTWLDEHLASLTSSQGGRSA